MKTLTREQLEGRKEKAVRFVEDVLDDPDRADEIAAESLEDYAARRRFTLKDNPGRRAFVPTNPELAKRIRKLEEKIKSKNPRRVPVAVNGGPDGGATSNVRLSNSQGEASVTSRSELLHRIKELENENDELQDRLDEVADLAEAPEDDEDEDAEELKDKLNEILDVAAPDEVEASGDNEGNE